MFKRTIDESPNLAGGVNTGLHASLLSENEMASLINFYVYGDSIYPRLGSSRLTSIPLDGAISLGCYKSSSGRFKLISVGNTVQEFTPDIVPSAPNNVPLRYGPAYSAIPNKLPFIFQGRDCYYIIDPSGAPLRRGTDLFYEKAGIPAPLSAPNIAAGGAGVMTAANYKVAITYQNSVTTDESDFIVSANLALGANLQIAVSAIPTSPTPQVDIVNIYVTPPDQTNIYLLAGSVANGVAVFNINLTPLQLETLMPTTNGLPPENIVAGCIFDNSLFVSDGQFLYKSGYLQYETFDINADVQPILNADGHDCNILYPWGSRLIAGKPNYIVYFTPTGTGDYIPNVLSDKYGVYSPHAMKSIENILIWFDGENFQRSDNGVTPKNISTLKIKTYLDNIPVTKKDLLKAEIVPKINSYVVVMPQNNDTYITLAYNYKAEAWSVFSIGTNPLFLVEGYDVNEERQLYSISENFNIDLMFNISSVNDSGVDITYSWLSKGYKASKDSTLQTFLRSFSLLTTTMPKTGTISVYENGSTIPVMSIPAYMYNAYDDWKAFMLSTLRKSSGASYIQIGFTFTGSLPKTFHITKLLLELVSGPLLKRQFTSIDV